MTFNAELANDPVLPVMDADRPIDGQELAAYIAGKLCHDFISPAGAILSGLDLLSDPTAQDMRDDAMNLIQQSATKMAALVQFCRVAFGAATTSERFSAEDLRALVADMVAGGRASLDWSVSETEFAKPAARALVNLAYLAASALPSGGVATITTAREGDTLVLRGTAVGNRARLKPEAVTGFAGERLTDGLPGQWIQPYWLWLTVSGAGGTLTAVPTEGQVEIIARMAV
ncbi:histidine phosphotransferase ChpT [Brevundimonas variabilis]|uniref:Histidine phosphotransferase ChpT n=1 Tax=Brevundimonas variabilis TaxID=74312 RepID=A0A7W9CFM8_9CAUL|nr:histidine phosphotransferase family protein [Brevundimonas variabilis]MBB5744588.1 histidine phosphotransferase ChpT [Brevundimonas variabilis]